MSDDLQQRLKEAAGPLPPLTDEVFSRVSERHTPPIAPVVLATVLLLAAAGLLALVSLGIDRNEVGLAAGPDVPTMPRSASPTVTPHVSPAPAAVDDWDVLAVFPSQSFDATRLVTDENEMRRAWDFYNMSTPPPALPDGKMGILVTVYGDCRAASDLQRSGCSASPDDRWVG